jgi:release factor glutamine methyltransferase
MTLQEWLQRGEAHLRGGPHPERARRDAELLLLHVVRLERAALIARWDEVLDPEEAARYVVLLEQRLAGEPIQYIFGETEFFGLAFEVTPDVLIPRPETEHLVEKVLEMAAAFERPRIVDVGTGSGAIAVTLAHLLPDSQVTAIDLSSRALAVARRNAHRHQVAERIRFLRGNLLVPVAEERFDIVASNPPYVPYCDRGSLAVEVREHEPLLALLAGNDGLTVIRRLIPEAFAALAAGGMMAMEMGYGQSTAVGALLAEGGFERIEFMPDLQGIPRVAVAQRPGKFEKLREELPVFERAANPIS